MHAAEQQQPRSNAGMQAYLQRIITNACGVLQLDSAGSRGARHLCILMKMQVQGQREDATFKNKPGFSLRAQVVPLGSHHEMVNGKTQNRLILILPDLGAPVGRIMRASIGQQRGGALRGGHDVMHLAGPPAGGRGLMTVTRGSARRPGSRRRTGANAAGAAPAHLVDAQGPVHRVRLCVQVLALGGERGHRERVVLRCCGRAGVVQGGCGEAMWVVGL